MSALAELALDGLRGDEETGLAVLPELGAALAERVKALDPALLERELSGLRAFCDLMLGRGATAVAALIIEAVADALAERPAAVAEPTRTEERRREALVGAPGAPRAPVASNRAGGGSLLALRAARR